MILLSGNDMARLGCGECSGCSACCEGMGQSILLDPYDIFQLQAGTGQSYAGEDRTLCRKRNHSSGLEDAAGDGRLRFSKPRGEMQYSPAQTGTVQTISSGQAL